MEHVPDDTGFASSDDVEVPGLDCDIKRMKNIHAREIQANVYKQSTSGQFHAVKNPDKNE